MIHLKYASYILRHKWFVFMAACDLGIPWLGFIHDTSKLSPDEWIPYAWHFYGPGARNRRDSTGYYKPTDTGDAAFDFAWMLHQKRNKHHWQWWLLPEDDGGTKILPMPDRYRREMLADWRGASKAQGYGGNVTKWFLTNRSKMQLHPDTTRWLEDQLGLEKEAL